MMAEYTAFHLNKLETIEEGVYGLKKIDTDKERVWIDGNTIVIEELVSGLDSEYWNIKKEYKVNEKVVRLGLKSEVVDFLEKILIEERVLDNYGSDEIIEKLIATFDDNTTVEIDVCNGGHEDGSSPYININWYQNGSYVYDEVEDTLLGIHTMEDEDNNINYIVEIFLEE